MKKRKAAKKDDYIDVNHCGQHWGYHFIAREMAPRVFMGFAIPPCDGKPYTTDANKGLPDAIDTSADGVVVQFGDSIAEVMSKCVDEAITRQTEQEDRRHERVAAQAQT